MKRVSIFGLCLTAILACGTGTTALAMPMAASSCNDAFGSITATGRGDYDACIGPNSGNEGAMNFAALLAAINGGVFDGITNWTPDAKYDSGTSMVDAGPNASDFTMTGQPGNSGTWSIDTPTTDAIVLTLKTNTFWSAYYFASGVATSGGNWDTLGVSINHGQGQGISHSTISFAPGNTPPPPGGEVPEPSTVLLFGSGLAGLGYWRWKKGNQSEAVSS
ncbi:MAG: PEP-CTERM sorting domain-containing protein [Nitrospirales bacterium]|nr:PEP-CTERM sorting domain-containing protein [Nitrospira sp.]MDR4500542.1 PEP-CTERM sorting domain-containing protein [Nitrospirales bacterium]